MKKILIIFLIGLCFYDIAFVLLFDRKYENNKIINEQYEIITVKEETTYYNKYMCINKKKDKFIFYSKNDYIPGDIVKIEGEFHKGETRRNYKGFDYNNYLKQQKIYGIITSDNEEYIKQKRDLYYILGKIKTFIIEKINSLYGEEKEEEFLRGILLGDAKGISSDIKEQFKKSSVSHILAISGLHITYIVSGIKVVISKVIKSKKKQNIILILSLIFFCLLTGGSPSCIRASIMNIALLLSELVYRKNNFYISYIISFVILIAINPYNVFNVGMWLSYLGTLGIVLFSNLISKIIIHKTDINKSIVLSFSTSVSAQILIFPIMIYCFNTFSLSFFIPNIIISYIIGPILIIGYILVFIPYKVSNVFSIIEKALIKVLYKTTEICGKIPFSKIYLKTPSFVFIIAYYSVICVFIYKFKKKRFLYLKRIIMTRHILMKTTICIIIFIFSISLFNVDIDINNNFKMYFIDVGQGDSCLIKTPLNKTIIIDGGEDKEGKTVLPYLLDRKVDKIDYMIISHFDSDHVDGLIPVIRELEVKRVIISKQLEESDNYDEFLKIIKNKKTVVYVVQKGDRISIEKDIYLDILWPDDSKPIDENPLNNNSIVCKICYKNFSILFTGDIEELAEKSIVGEEKGILNSTVLKVAHHGSKTSSTKEFLNLVTPKIALIGVGKDNKFGHPNYEIIERLEEAGCKIYRTDEMGEITIKVDNNGRIKTSRFIN